MESIQPDNLETTDHERRSFLKFLLSFSVITTLAGVLTPITGYLVPPPSDSGGSGGRILAGTTSDIPVGHGKVVPMGSKPVIVTNTTQGGIKAFSAICTHLGCIVRWDETNQGILCPCHDGWFNPVTGAVMSGPPPAPLPHITVSVEGEEIYVGDT